MWWEREDKVEEKRQIAKQRMYPHYIQWFGRTMEEEEEEEEREKNICMFNELFFTRIERDMAKHNI